MGGRDIARLLLYQEKQMEHLMSEKSSQYSDDRDFSRIIDKDMDKSSEYDRKSIAISFHCGSYRSRDTIDPAKM